MLISEPRVCCSSRRLTLLATGSKEGKLYILDHDDLGGFQPESDSQIVESLRTGPGWLHGTPTYWNVSESLDSTFGAVAVQDSHFACSDLRSPCPTKAKS